MKKASVSNLKNQISRDLDYVKQRETVPDKQLGLAAEREGFNVLGV